RATAESISPEIHALPLHDALPISKNFTRYNKRWPYVAVPNAVTAPLDSSARWQLNFTAQNAPTTPKQPVMIVAPMVLTYIHYPATYAVAPGTGPSGMPRMPSIGRA